MEINFPGFEISAHPAFPQNDVSGTKAHFVKTLSKYVCYDFYKNLTVDAVGDIYECGCSKDMAIIGNVLKNNMNDIWLNHPQMVKNRQMLENGEYPAICLDCNARPCANEYRYMVLES